MQVPDRGLVFASGQTTNGDLTNFILPETHFFSINSDTAVADVE